MMDTDIHIAQLEARYHLPPDAPGSLGVAESRTRLDRLLRQTFDDALPPALARLGVAEHEDVCIRELRIPVRLRLSEGDQSLVAAWSRALAETLAELLDTSSSGVPVGVRPGADVIRYRTPIASLIDFASGVARGDGTRAWAWRQLGYDVSPDDDPARWAAALVTACEQRPESIVAVIGALADQRGGRLIADLVARVAAVDGWWRLAASAWAAAGGDLEWLVAPLPTLDATPSGATPSGATPSGVDIAAAVSRNAGTIVRAAQAQSDVFLGDARSRRATAALALLQRDPASVRQVGCAPEQEAPRTPAGTPPPVAVRLAAVLAALGGAGGTVPDSVPGASGGGASGGNARASAVEVAPRAPVPAVDEPVVAAATDEDVVGTGDPVSVPTEWGGLLFLVRLLGDSPLLDAMSASALARQRSLRWCLLELARALLPSAAADDPAVLAFAGLGPEVEPPDLEHRSQSHERRIVRVWAAVLRSALAALIDGVDSDGLVEGTCRRRARIVADPGWIEVRLPLASVELPIRRAGLDLDPGWVPWLGVVIKLTYTAEVMP